MSDDRSVVMGFGLFSGIVVSICAGLFSIVVSFDGASDDEEVISITDKLGHINGVETIEVIEGFEDREKWLSDIFTEEAQSIINGSELMHRSVFINNFGKDSVTGFNHATGTLSTLLGMRQLYGTAFNVDEDITHGMRGLTNDERDQLATNFRARLIEETIARYEEETGETVCFTDSREETVRYRATGQCNGPTP
tara:strand:- start:99 stop:683 length:585 start_codon:yes stop_codon:yes gene_type:complete